MDKAQDLFNGMWTMNLESLIVTNFGFDTQLRQFQQKTVWDRQ